MDDYYLVCNGRIVSKEEEQDETQVYHVCYRLPGGKGGFGSMLRTIGAQIEKTTNREAMRDLSGRRMRDINNEKKLADWVAGAADRERELNEKRKERLEKRRAEAEGRMHKFGDVKYMEQKEVVSSNLDNALLQGLKRSAAETSSAPLEKKGKSSKPCTSWTGLDLDDLSSSDEEEVNEGNQKSELEQLRESLPISAELPCPQEEPAKGVIGSKAVIKTIEKEDLVKDTYTNQEELDSQPSSTNSQEPKATEELSKKDDFKSMAINEERDSEPQNKAPEPGNTEPIDLESLQSALELEQYGLDHLKHELTRRGLKCGGSLQQRAERLYSVKGLSSDQINPTLLAKKRK